jgi:hypothetical protein
MKEIGKKNIRKVRNMKKKIAKSVIKKEHVELIKQRQEQEKVITFLVCLSETLFISTAYMLVDKFLLE